MLGITFHFHIFALYHSSIAFRDHGDNPPDALSGRLPGFIRSMSYMEKLHEVAQSPRCNDSALATLLSILLPVPGVDETGP